MKIALVSPYDITVPGGVNAHIAHLAREFRGCGHSVRVIAPGMPGPRTDPETILIGRSVPIPSGGSLARVTLSLWLGRTVKRVLAAERFDVVHLHEPFVPMLPVEFLRHSRAVNVATFHAAHDGGSRLYGLFRPLLRTGARRLDGMIAVSPAAAHLISRYVRGRYDIIPNGVDVARFATPVPRPAALADGRPYVLFVGRFESRKGLPVLLRAYAVLKERRPDVRLVIVGDGRRRARYERWVAEHGLPGVHFAGYVPDAILPAYYQHAAVFCAPNTGDESFGIVLLEAMAAGCPVVASNIEGFAGVLDDGAEGLLVPARDPEALGAALERVLTDDARARAMAGRGAARVRELAWPRIAEWVLSYYEYFAASPRPHLCG